MAYFIARNFAKGGYTMKFVARNAVERSTIKFVARSGMKAVDEICCRHTNFLRAMSQKIDKR